MLQVNIPTVGVGTKTGTTESATDEVLNTFVWSLIFDIELFCIVGMCASVLKQYVNFIVRNVDLSET